MQTRTRTCVKPQPAFVTDNCNGDDSETQACNSDIPCPSETLDVDDNTVLLPHEIN